MRRPPTSTLSPVANAANRLPLAAGEIEGEELPKLTESGEAASGYADLRPVGSPLV